MTADILTPAVMEWAERTRPGARVAGCAVRPLAGGAVARRVEQVTLHMTGHHDPLELVRKQAPAHEIAGLRAAQAVRPETTAIPELVAWGSDWLITPLAPGSPLAWGDAVPANLVDALAALHARYQGAAGHHVPLLPAGHLVRGTGGGRARLRALVPRPRRRRHRRRCGPAISPDQPGSSVPAWPARPAPTGCRSRAG